MKLLIIRNDKLGDFVLSLPVFKLLKHVLPDAELHALLPEYTASLANVYPYIDNVIIDSGADSTLTQYYHLLKKLRHEKYDAVITLFSTTRIGLLTFAAGIQYRLAPATKLAQLFYNHKLTQRRSRSLKPEYEYNIDLAKEFLSAQGFNEPPDMLTPILKFNEKDVTDIQASFIHTHNIPAKNRLVFIHAGTGGSATNLSLAQYAELIQRLAIHDNISFVITAGPNEDENADRLLQLAKINNGKKISIVVFHSSKGLVYFSKLIQCCNLFISASTGPLHIAGALNRRTAAFYQRRRSATALRWQTLNDADKRLAFSPEEHEHESDLHSINIKNVANEISQKFFKV